MTFSNIFSQVDAFIKRCEDVLEICEAQVHFLRKVGKAKQPLPVFSGTKGITSPKISKDWKLILSGSEVTRGLQRVEVTFERSIQTLREVQSSILDVKSTAWHDHFNKFKSGVRDLEVMIQNIMINAFDDVSTVSAGAELLAYFTDVCMFSFYETPS